MMTPDKIRARLDDLKRQRDQQIANANALGGAIQDCEYWLAEAVKVDEATKAINSSGRASQTLPPAPAHDGPPG